MRGFFKFLTIIGVIACMYVTLAQYAPNTAEWDLVSRDEALSITACAGLIWFVCTMRSWGIKQDKWVFKKQTKDVTKKHLAPKRVKREWWATRAEKLMRSLNENASTFYSLAQPKPEEFSSIEREVLYHDSYEPKYLLTKPEYRFWKYLKTIAKTQSLIICPKVRLKDLTKPLDGNTHQNARKDSALRLLGSKHIDFVICNADLYCLFALEYDDSTHDTNAETKKSDIIKDAVFKQISLPLIRLRYKEYESAELLKNDIKIALEQLANTTPELGSKVDKAMAALANNPSRNSSA